LWLVKWFLLVPHLVIRVGLWIAFIAITLVAHVAVLFTGGYPPAAIPAFNVGVLQGSWRVHYGYQVLGTDRSAPFALADVADYPAWLLVDPPTRLPDYPGGSHWSPGCSPPASGRISKWWAAIGPMLRRRRISVTATIVMAGAFGRTAGWWTPRGPITTSETLATIGLSLLVGAFVGLVRRSRWAMVLAPVTFAVVFELARIGTDGPMVDGVHPGSMYGVVAFLLSRGVHALLALLPMLLGTTFGAAASRHLDGGRQPSREPTRPAMWVRRPVHPDRSLGPAGPHGRDRRRRRKARRR
jgi:hypothetical protein